VLGLNFRLHFVWFVKEYLHSDYQANVA